MLGFSQPKTRDLAFTKGVLIHIHPDDLRRADEVLYRCTSRYLLVIADWLAVAGDLRRPGVVKGQLSVCSEEVQVVPRRIGRLENAGVFKVGL